MSRNRRIALAFSWLAVSCLPAEAGMMAGQWKVRWHIDSSLMTQPHDTLRFFCVAPNAPPIITPSSRAFTSCRVSRLAFKETPTSVRGTLKFSCQGPLSHGSAQIQLSGDPRSQITLTQSFNLSPIGKKSATLTIRGDAFRVGPCY